ncbi:hypothetical protein FB2170_01776 [Maribacter sp. HTCC2170]|nr:hypothetical protein FB2170_01776 [Maribacter sp. HTCC2170]
MNSLGLELLAKKFLKGLNFRSKVAGLAKKEPENIIMDSSGVVGRLTNYFRLCNNLSFEPNRFAK